MSDSSCLASTSAASGGCKYTSSRTNSRFAIASLVGYRLRTSERSVGTSAGCELAANERELNHAERITELGDLGRARFAVDLVDVVAEHRLAAFDDRGCQFLRRRRRPTSPAPPCRNVRAVVAVMTCSCHLSLGVLSRARRAANATNRSESPSKRTRSSTRLVDAAVSNRFAGDATDPGIRIAEHRGERLRERGVILRFPSIAPRGLAAQGCDRATS